MENIEKVKQLQKLLFEKSGWTWTEASYREMWFHEPRGDHWDQWQKLGLVPVDFCINCGVDLDAPRSSRCFISNNYSEQQVPLFLCDHCYPIVTGQPVPPMRSEGGGLLGKLLSLFRK